MAILSTAPNALPPPTPPEKKEITKEATKEIAKEIRKEAKDVTFNLNLSPSSSLPLKKGGSLGIQADGTKTFFQFVSGPSNNMALASAQTVAFNPGRKGKYPCLYFYGGSGLGKTHLLHAIANSIREQHPEMVYCLTTTRHFMKEMVDAIKKKALDEFQKKYSQNIDVLMIDDIHELKNKHSTQNEFFHIFNELHNSGKQLVFTSDTPPQEIEGLAEKIKTRLQWGLLVDIQQPNFETRLSILKKKANQLDLYLPNDTLELLAGAIKANIRELEGALIRLSAFTDVMKLEVDTEVARDLLGLDKVKEKEKKFSLKEIANFVASKYNLTTADLLSRSRNKDLIKARHMAMYLSRKLLDSTHQEIADFYSRRNYSTVVHAIKTISEKMKMDSQFKDTVNHLDSQLSTSYQHRENQ